MVKQDKKMDFNTWYNCVGKPEKHKAGMKAYVKDIDKKKLTAEQWTALFSKY